MRIVVIALAGGALIAATASPGSAATTFTVNHARTLPTRELARELLGERLGSKVIEAVRHEYAGSSSSVPQYVEFYTQPELSMPVLNGICRTDVIIVEYNWPDIADANADKPLQIAHIDARPRYKSFPRPPGEPGDAGYDQAQAASCAKMTTARDAFHAPSAGAAQWLTEIAQEYSSSNRRFKFTCSDFADTSCAAAGEALKTLEVKAASDVQEMDCPKGKTGDQVNYCFRLTFPYPNQGGTSYPPTADYPVMESPEWILTVFAGMRDGMAPVKIRSLHVEHVEKPIVMN